MLIYSLACIVNSILDLVLLIVKVTQTHKLYCRTSRYLIKLKNCTYIPIHMLHDYTLKKYGSCFLTFMYCDKSFGERNICTYQ